METTQDLFDRYKSIEHEVMETQIFVAKRIDSYMDIKRQADAYFGDGVSTMNDILNYQDFVVNTYEKIMEIADAFDYDTFCVEEIDDPYESLLIPVEDCHNEKDLFMSYLRFLAIRPFAERAFRMHQSVMDDIMKETSDGVEETD